MLEVRLLGEQTVAGTPDGRPLPSRALALLAHLVLTDTAQSRQQLAGALWPDSTEAQARTNLRRELHTLRAALGDDPSLVVTAATLAWRDTPTCRVDVRRFRAARVGALASLAADDPVGFGERAHEAIAAYRGELMPGSYDEWALAQRDLLRQECVDLCVSATREWRRCGDLDRAAGAARLRVALEPLAEAGYRDLMHVQAEAGDRAAAMQTYHRCATVLERELGLAPDAETTRTVERLLGEGSVDRPDQAPRATPARAGTGLVGRAAETATLLGHWARAAAGGAAMVLVTGDAGVGKSRLVAELIGTARAAGAAVATSRCFGSSGRLALAPVADWLRAGDLRAALPGLDPAWRAEVDRLAPGTTPAPAAGDGPRALSDGWQRHRLYEGLARAVVAVRRPVLLVLDDLQWCDEETLAWLTFLLGFAADAPLLVAATGRAGELDDVLHALAAPRKTGQVHDISLGPLDAAAADRLATDVRGRALGAEERAFVQAATGGYPLFVVEAARSLPAVPEPAGFAVPATGLDGVLRHRLEDTSAAARTVAELAAAVGRDFDLDLLIEASDLDAEDLVHAVDELWGRRILREQGSGYDFSHDLLRDAAYALASPPRRWLLHRRLAQGLELLHAGHLDDVASQLADQYDRGGRTDRAVHYRARSAALAESVFANAEALRQHQRILELIATQPEGKDRDAKELDALQAMVPSLTAVRGYSAPEVLVALERAAALAERLDRRPTLLAAYVGLNSVLYVRGQIARAMDLGTRALDLAARETDTDLVAQAHFAYAGSAASLGMPATAIEHFTLATTLASDDASTMLGARLRVHGQAWSAHAHWLLGDDEQAQAATDAALALARTVDHPWSLAVALSYTALTAQLRGRPEQVTPATAELRDLCERYEFPYYREWAVLFDGWASGGAEGAAAIARAIAALRAQGSFARMPYWLSLQAQVQVDLGDLDAARAVLDGARAAARQHDDRWWLPEVLRLRAALAARPTAVALLHDGRALAEQQQSPALVARCDADLATLARPTTLDVRPRGVRAT